MTKVMNVTRRLLGATLLGAMISGAVSVEPVLAQDRSIKVWFGRDNFVPEDEFAAFKAENPGINVEFETIRLEDVSAQLILATRSGNAPDIVQIHARRRCPVGARRCGQEFHAYDRGVEATLSQDL